MDTTVLHHFLVIAETLSFTKAAEILDKAEPVLSRQISRLENEIGTPLFYRNHGGIALTPAGMIFMKSVSDTEKKLSNAVSEMRAIAKVQRKNISVGIIENHFISQNGKRLFSSFVREHPDISLKYFSFSMNDLIQFLKDGKIDFVYGALIDFTNSEYSHNRSTLAYTICWSARTARMKKTRLS
jgi:DNA-binding transcriptional LysR family regulator